MWGVWINKLNHLPCWLIDETLASQKNAFITRMIQGYESYLRIIPHPRKILTSRLLFRIIICSIEKASSEWRVLTAWNSPTAENTEIETGHKTDPNWFKLDPRSVFIFELVCSYWKFGNCFGTLSGRLSVVLPVVKDETGSGQRCDRKW